jgi:uncharacterized protein (UPF0548 family)
LIRLFRPPTDDAIRRIVAAQAHLAPSYPEVGATRFGAGPLPRGYAIDHNRLQLGAGEAVFAAACAAVRAWKMFAQGGWTRVVEPSPGAAPREGIPVAVVVRAPLLGFVYLVAHSRVVYTVDDGAGGHVEGPDGVRRYGFAYGTLPAHFETGEERFSVEIGPDGAVWSDVLAFSRPGHPVVALGYPYARAMQKRFSRAVGPALARAVREARS